MIANGDSICCVKLRNHNRDGGRSIRTVKVSVDIDKLRRIYRRCTFNVDRSSPCGIHFMCFDSCQFLHITGGEYIFRRYRECSHRDTFVGGKCSGRRSSCTEVKYTHRSHISTKIHLYCSSKASSNPRTFALIKPLIVSAFLSRSQNL